MIRVVITHFDGRIGARTVRRPEQIPAAVGDILLGFGASVRSFGLKLLEVEPDELPPDADVATDARRIADRLITDIGRRLILKGST